MFRSENLRLGNPRLLSEPKPIFAGGFCLRCLMITILHNREESDRVTSIFRIGSNTDFLISQIGSYYEYRLGVGREEAEKWSEQDVENWLRKKGWEIYIEAFKKEGVIGQRSVT